MNYFVDFASGHLNKNGEELCGDNVEFIRSNNQIIGILSDGLGSGVKANILSTLTSKIAITMLKEGLSIEEVVDTLIHTLPVCKIRELAYSTFTIIKVDNTGQVYVAEFDNPKVYFLRKGKLLPLPRNERVINGQKISESTFQLHKGDTIVFVSDGVIHAGVGKTLNLGWGWDEVANYLELFIDENISAKNITNHMLQVVNDFYLGKPGDDVTVVTIKAIQKKHAVLFSGPPKDSKDDQLVVEELTKNDCIKIVCGGTAANIVSRELDEELKTNFEFYDPTIPPTASIEGIDLVTEGVLTLKGVVNKLKQINHLNDLTFLRKNDGASRLTKILYEDCTNITLLIGKAINPAHQNPDFPQELSIKLSVLKELEEVLIRLGKIVEVQYY
ncbi:serine/threonine-protein phosphatase [Mycoplasmatota bacterium]|nr:serine/threonine-protein phosphatase [Mycoplasmatota bacterium]